MDSLLFVGWGSPLFMRCPLFRGSNVFVGCPVFERYLRWIRQGSGDRATVGVYTL